MLMDSFSDLKDALANFISTCRQFNCGLSFGLKKNTFSTIILILKNGKNTVKFILYAVFLFNKC